MKTRIILSPPDNMIFETIFDQTLSDVKATMLALRDGFGLSDAEITRALFFIIDKGTFETAPSRRLSLRAWHKLDPQDPGHHGRDPNGECGLCEDMQEVRDLLTNLGAMPEDE